HEVDAALDDDVGVDLHRLAGELQAVADEIGDAILDFRSLIIVREDDGVALLLERVHRLHIGRKERPFDGGNDILHAGIERGGLARDLLAPVERRHREHAVFTGGNGWADARGRRPRMPRRGAECLQDGHWFTFEPYILTLSIYRDENIRHVRTHP